MKISDMYASVRNIQKTISKLKFSIFPLIFLIQILLASFVQASLTINVPISSNGTILYPPDPSKNLVTIPDSFMRDINGASSSYALVDYSVTHNGHPSVRVEADYVRGTREVNSIWASVKPGDHIVWKVWCKTSDGVENTPYTGGLLGVDLIGAYGELINTVDALPRDYTTSIDGQWRSGNWDSYHYRYVRPEGDAYPYLGTPVTSQFLVPFDNDWTEIYWDFVVPSTTYYYVDDNYAPTQITHVSPWIGARELTDGIVWFASSDFYINP